LVTEIGGKAYPLARVGDAELVAGAARCAVKAKRESARQMEASSPTLARRFDREADEIQEFAAPAGSGAFSYSEVGGK